MSRLSPVRPGATDREVAELAQAAAYPAISLMLETTPASRMTVEDERRLWRLQLEAQQILAELVPQGGSQLMSSLRRLVEVVAGTPTGRGLALYCSQTVERAYRLPQRVQSRAVVEPTFATRELVQALHRTPPHLVLRLRRGEARLYRGCADELDEVVNGFFPAPLPTARPERLRASLRTVDRALAAERRAYPSPLVLAGAAELVDDFREVSTNLDRLGGLLVVPEDADLVSTSSARRALLDEYLSRRRDDALAALRRTRTSRPHLVVDGVLACWDAVRHGRPAVLAVEEGFVHPVRIDVDTPVSPVSPVDSRTRYPHVRQDLVDDLIELVITGGGWVALVEDGALSESGRVAMTMRSS